MPKAYLKYYAKKGGIIRQSVTTDDEENHKLRTIVLGADFQDTTLLQCDILYMHHGCLRHLIPNAGTNGNQSPMHTGVRYETRGTCTVVLSYMWQLISTGTLYIMMIVVQMHMQLRFSFTYYNVVFA